MQKALHAFSANAIMEELVAKKKNKSPNFFGFKADTTGKPKDLTAISASVCMQRTPTITARAARL